ncbi:hypothetical protein A4X13_0g359 [Tilletia indica]|uniref:HSF-type DNA-binding domain-containing protein n=1 Tax=Tilletia indica TaxID=43049 RepID=A0A8T8THD7_9BASI|nr:hypothetical protein A4X13_0g359 [Tilletia indica]
MSILLMPEAPAEHQHVGIRSSSPRFNSHAHYGSLRRVQASHQNRRQTSDMNPSEPIQDRTAARKHPLNTSEDDRRGSDWKRSKTTHDSGRHEQSAMYHPSQRSSSGHRPSHSPESERRSRSPVHAEGSNIVLSSHERLASRSPPPHFARSQDFHRDAKPVHNEAPSFGGGRPLPYHGSETIIPSRTSAADAFRSVRGEGREREAHGEAAGAESRSKHHGGPSSSYAPMSPEDTHSGRPRVHSTASERDRRQEPERERGHTLPSMRTPRSPAYPLAFNSPGPSSGYGSRGPNPHPEGPPLTSMLAPPSGFGPSSKGLPPLSHRRHDTDPSGSNGGERMPAPMTNVGPLPPLPHLQRSDRGPQPNYPAPPPPRNDRYQGPEHAYPGAGPSPQPPFLPSQSVHYEAESSNPGAPMPITYGNNSEVPLAAGTGVPGSLSSLGSQVVPDRRPAKQQPSFVNKLYSMLEDDRIANMISWAPSGTVFSVANPSVFSKVVLPQWFKHSNWQSFVRQLNMYGFNKVNQTFQGDPIDEIQVWEFRHPRFRRGEVHLLNEIKRKNSRQKRAMSPTTQSISGGDYESRRDASPTPSPEMSSLSMDEHARQLSDPRMRGEEYPYMAAGPSSWPAPSPAHTGMPFAHDGPPNQQGPPPPQPSMGPQGRHAPPNPAEGDPSVIANLRDETHHRLDDMSDRIDAIIRHSNYLEAQLRTVSERLHQSQEAEQVIGTHMARTLNVLISLGAVNSGSPEASEEARQSMLAACRTEMDVLRSYLGFDGPPPPPGAHHPIVFHHPGPGPGEHAGHGGNRMHDGPPGPPGPPPPPGHDQYPPRHHHMHPVPVRSTSLLDRRQSAVPSEGGLPGGYPYGPGPGPAPGPGPGPPGDPYGQYRRESFGSEGAGRRN